MKLVRTTRLVSDERIYEIDLCEVGAGQYVVNFRHGRVGATLKDGTKTIVPVSEPEAERIFAKLVDDQRAKGYAAPGTPSNAPPTRQRTANRPALGDPQQRAAILSRLGNRRTWSDRDWPIERVLWRAGELALADAESSILALFGTGKPMRDYCAAWALARLGTAASVPKLEAILADAATTPPVRRITTLALQRCYDEASRATFDASLIALLPPALQEAIANEDADAFTHALEAHLAEVGAAGWGVVDLLYAIDRAVTRPAIVRQLESVPFDSPYFYFVRHILKAAEARRDARVFGVLAHRIDTTRATFSGRVNPRLHEPQAYSSTTRWYFRRRTWRTLRRMAEIGDPDYVKMAVGVLLPFEDDDADEPIESSEGPWPASYGKWATYLAFNGILYGESPRYVRSPNRRTWRLRPGERDDTPPAVREESFPELWDAQPTGLIHLLAESNATPVHGFAAKAIRSSPSFLERLDDDDVAMLLERPFEVTAALGLELAEKRWDAARPNLVLVRGLLRSLHLPARTKGALYTEQVCAAVLADGALLAEIVASPFGDVRELARRTIANGSVPDDIGPIVVARVIAWMMSLDDTPANDARAQDAARTLATGLAPWLETIGPDVVGDLLAHPLSGVQELGAELLLRAENVAPEAIVAVLHSPFANVRAVGMRLVTDMPDDVLAKMELLLARLSSDKNEDLRVASRAIVARLAKSHREACETITRALVEALVRRRLPEGAGPHIAHVLKEDLRAYLHALDASDTLRLLLSGSLDANEVGAVRFHELPPDTYDIATLVKLGSCDVLAVRQGVWRAFDGDVPRVRANMAEAARLLDAKWDDTRAFAFGFFREKLGGEAFSADVLVTIIDSVRPDVQAFGRELTTRHFREEDGPALMAKLAEHPSVAVQTYTTNYIARYATDRVGALEAMVPYFVTVLSRPNQGRVAKKRVLSFLESEGKKNAEAARVVLAILHRVAATVTIELRGAAIAAMIAIHHAQPDVLVPLRIEAPPIREARG